MNISKMKTWLLAGFSALSMLYACTADEYATGLEIHPENEKIGIGHDSSRTVKAYTYESENFISTSSSQTNYMLGYCNDPYLGTFRNDVIFQIINNNTTNHFLEDEKFGTSKEIIIDSLVFVMQCVESDGDLSEKQNFSIYEVEHDKEISSLNGIELDNQTLVGYYKLEPLLANYEFEPLRSWTDTTITKNSDLRIHIDNEDFIKKLSHEEVYSYNIDTTFKDTIINTDTITIIVKIDTLSYKANYNNDSLFKANVLNGFLLKPNESNSKSLSTIAFGSSNSTRLELHYRRIYMDSVDGEFIEVLDTLVHAYNIDKQYKANLYYNNLTKDIAHNTMYKNIDMAETDTVVFIKNNNCAYTIIAIDGIGDWEDSTNTLINKASIFIELNEFNYSDSTMNTPFYLIPNVYTYRKLEPKVTASKIPLLAHYNTNGYDPISPKFDYTRQLFGYEINITEEVQDLYRSKQWDEPIYLYLESTSNSASPNRVIINSSTNASPMKFMLTYSKY